ncbi:MAG TPA: c-type cytochrome [Gemmatimonadales bacterium]|nr:c-type cytochrome [Gemmatimonadales bacterium]
MTRQGRLRLTSNVILIASLGCGGDQRSGATPADTARQASDTVAAAATDTGAMQPRDTAPPATSPDTSATRRDTAPKVVAKPAPRRPRRAATPPPRPRADSATTVDTAAPTTTAAAPSDTRQTTPTAPTDTAAAQPAETTAASAAPSAQANAPVRDPYRRAPLDTVSQQVYDGWKQYNLNCARCHGEDVLGTTIAPHLLVSVKPDGPINTKELFVQTVCAGRPAKGMPAWCPLGMEMPTIDAIYAYVKGRSDAKLRPGRPALRPGG